jgi:hypothetical protein
MSNRPVEPKQITLTDERLNQVILENIRKLFEEDSRHFMNDYLIHISSKETVAV